ncbi:winged helix-turn-helix transcriptional regulator [Pseudomonas monteilii]|jgi:DNA-binding HxlR family transcriptional regulator|uniref:Transcriptional regulator n=1 Tax=Pseudomonas putida TaxID=303 RepID=A0AAD0L631_PSEPU|nr:HxlR family transcriptional regulator [Pseudomonas putida]MBH3455330.1 winged helix-turn-helix transcriptional regulator [Pseudomonas monteilii]RDL14367.1 HxlR family transcriptional regulator [Pseudomonas sp. LAMO17WK12:I3]RED00829.1 HxlR family transcriptional regulator [Pseudomonas sp. URMO17WK12:I10]SMF17726.1 transcriptional regulator, HxlR family [Pseudomonas sp. LAIL14HWK12:I11]SMR77405.1 transcriptional regulator, HxlR family [Pseudomonas sp. LAIL14HWK12:I10]SOD02811.1 transcriptio
MTDSRLDTVNPQDSSALDEHTLTAKLRRGDLFTGKCKAREVLSHVTSLWGMLCLIALIDGTLRYSELRRKVNGVSEKMLSQTLQRLEGDGFVRRTSYPIVPPWVEYDLTPFGQEAAAHVAALGDWLEMNLHKVPKA